MKKILIVDDIPQNLYMLEVLLTTNGYEIEEAANGIEALEIARKNPPEVIVSDILMPGMDGFSLCREWKGDKQLREIPFIFYTATYTDARDEKFALNLGAERFIVKPVDGDVFLAALKEVIQNHEEKKQIPHKDSLAKEDEFYKVYNETLIRKLEAKMMQLEKSNKRLAALYQVSSDMHKMRPANDLIPGFLQMIVESTGYQYMNYFCYDESRDKIVLQNSVGFPEEVLIRFKQELVFAMGENRGIVGLVGQLGQKINIPDTSKEPNWISLDPSIQSALYIPVQFKEKFRGVIGLYSKEIDGFTEQDERDISVLANNLATAIENIESQKQVMKQLTRISALHDIDLAINSNMDLHTTLNTFLKHVTNQLKIDAADILLFRSSSSTFEFSAARGFNTNKNENNNIRFGRSPDKKVAIERSIILETEFTEQTVSSDFLAMWKAEQFAFYLGAPLMAKGEVVGVLEVFHRTHFEPDAEWKDFFETLAGQAAIAINNTMTFDDLQRSNIELWIAYDATIKGWSRAMDLRDQETEGHTQRVTEMAVRLAETMGIRNEQIVHIRRGALLHDIGKLGVPDSILFKPGALTDEEMAVMRQHPQLAQNLLVPIEYLHPALDIPYCHHERWDGTGYPRGLSGLQIPLAARLFSVVNVWDALRSDRPYRKAWPEEKVLDYIREQSGKHFDPNVVEMFMKILMDKSKG